MQRAIADDICVQNATVYRSLFGAGDAAGNQNKK
jgi:hypothetical protein